MRVVVQQQKSNVAETQRQRQETMCTINPMCAAVTTVANIVFRDIVIESPQSNVAERRKAHNFDPPCVCSRR